MKKSLAFMAAVLAMGANFVHAAWTDGTFGGLSAKIYTPDSKPAAGRILFVNLHGCAQKNTDLQKSNWDGVAEKHNAVVVLPNAANSTLVGCWNYGNPSMNQSDLNAVVNGTKAFVADSKYGIDKNQVYLTGISSGATFAATIGCAYPDLYAGVASASGPTIKSNQMNAMSGENPNVDTVVSYCKSLSSGRAESYKTQLYAQSYGADPAAGDGIIGKGFIEPNHKVQQKLYGLIGAASYKNDIPGSLPAAGHTNTSEVEYYVADPLGGKRVALIVVPGMGHAWPGGVPKSGSVGSYVSNKFDFGEWLAVNFTANNCRMAANAAKPICSGKADDSVSNLRCVSATETAVTIAWDKPAVEHDGFKVTQGGVSQKTTATTYTWSNLSKGKAYEFAVAATKGSADLTAKTVSCSTVGDLTAPTSLRGTPTSNSVALNWDAVAQAVKYNIKRNGTNLLTVTANTHGDTGLSADTSYEYCVAGVSASGAEGPATCVTVKTLSASVSVAGSCTEHYVAKRLDVSGYLACGKKYGYINKIQMYQCGSTWSDRPDCSPRSF